MGTNPLPVLDGEVVVNMSAAVAGFTGRLPTIDFDDLSIVFKLLHG